MRRAIIEFDQVTSPIIERRTKFGGYPAWAREPEWPLSNTTGNPMRFIAQVEITPELFPDSERRMAYVFMTDEEEYVDGTWEPDGGENAVIIQPGTNEIRTCDLREGPTLQKFVKVSAEPRLQPHDVEFDAKLVVGDDPPFVAQDEQSEWTERQRTEYVRTLEANKVGGTPLFLQADEFPDAGRWVLLLQIDSTTVPFDINFGDAGVGYVFIRPNGRTGKFLFQSS